MIPGMAEPEPTVTVRRRRPRPPPRRRGDDGARAAGRPRDARSAVPRARLHARSGGVRRRAASVQPVALPVRLQLRARRRRPAAAAAARPAGAAPRQLRAAAAAAVPGGADHLRRLVGAPRRVDAGAPTGSPSSRFVPWSAKRAAHITTISEHARTDLLDLFDWLDPARVTVLPLAVDARFAPVRARSAAASACPSRTRSASAPSSRARTSPACSRPGRRCRPAARAATPCWRSPAGRSRRPARYAALADQLGIADTRALARLRRRRRPARAAGRRALPRLPEPVRGLRPARGGGDGGRLPRRSRPDTTSLPETAAGAALLVDPLSPTAIADAIARLLSDEAERARLRELGLARAAKLSWTRSAEVLAGVYTDVMSATARR